MIDPNVGLALLTAIGTVVASVFYGGRQVGKIEAAVSRIAQLEVSLKESIQEIPKLRIDLGVLQDLYPRMRSDYKNLRNEITEIRKELTEARVKLASQHDE